MVLRLRDSVAYIRYVQWRSQGGGQGAQRAQTPTDPPDIT